MVPRRASGPFLLRVVWQGYQTESARPGGYDSLSVIAETAYSDFLMSDYAKSMPAIAVPVIAFAADSGVFPNGIAMGKAIANLVPQGTFIPFEDTGHILFYEQCRSSMPS